MLHIIKGTFQPHKKWYNRALLRCVILAVVACFIIIIFSICAISSPSERQVPYVIPENHHLYPLRVIANAGAYACSAQNTSYLAIPDPQNKSQHIDVGCAFYCVQPPLSAEDEAAGVDPTMLAYDVTPDEAAAEVSRRRSDPLYKWQDMFTCAWVVQEAIASTTCDITKDGVYYQYIPPIAHTAMGPSDLKSPLNYVNANQCPMDLIGQVGTALQYSCPHTPYIHTALVHGESSCNKARGVFDRYCSIKDIYTTHRRNKDGSPRPFYTYVGGMKVQFSTIRSYLRYVESHASPELAAADAALQDELKPFYDRYVFPPLDTVSTFAAWSKRKSAIAAIITKSHDGRSDFLTALREFYPVDNLGRHNRTAPKLMECEAGLSDRSVPINGNPNIGIADRAPLYRRSRDAPSPLNTTAYDSHFVRKYSAVRCAFQQYKFVLVLENSIEDDYVTEKVYNALLSGAIPIVIGAPNIDDFTPRLKCADPDASVFLYPSVHAPSGTARMKIRKPFINAIIEFGAVDVEASVDECVRGKRKIIRSTSHGTVPLQRLAEYLRWLETSPDAVERYLSWWRCSKWGAKFQSVLNVPHYPCGVCARSHRQHQRDGRAYSLGPLGPFNTSTRASYVLQYNHF